MSQAEKQALALRDLAVIVAKAKGATTTQITAPNQPGQYVFEDARLRIVYNSTTPQALDVYRRPPHLCHRVTFLLFVLNDAVRISINFLNCGLEIESIILAPIVIVGLRPWSRIEMGGFCHRSMPRGYISTLH